MYLYIIAELIEWRKDLGVKMPKNKAIGEKQRDIVAKLQSVNLAILIENRSAPSPFLWGKKSSNYVYFEKKTNGAKT